MRKKRKNGDHVADVAMEVMDCVSRLKLDVNMHRQTHP